MRLSPDGEALRLFRAGVRGAHPKVLLRKPAVLEALRRAAEARGGRLVLLAAGKAALPMRREALRLLPRPPDAALLAAPEPPIRAGHPEPNRASLRAGARALRALKPLGAADTVVALLSGGASSLLALPAPGVRLEDLKLAVRALMRAGAPIGEINALRKHLSAIKGGQLARAAAPAAVLQVLLSDVPGDDPALVGSGPFSPDPTTFEGVLSSLRRRGVLGSLPRSVRRHLDLGAARGLPETPKAGDPCFDGVRTVLAGGLDDAIGAAAQEARLRGFSVRILPERLEGEARALGTKLGRRVRAEVQRGGKPLCLIGGGETVVTVEGGGRGGRSQELALSLALEIEGLPGVVALAAGTDGRDGPTPAAGAVATGRTVAEARRRGLDPRRFLAENDSYGFFRRAGGLVVTGPTGTNVGDLFIALIAPPAPVIL